MIEWKDFKLTQEKAREFKLDDFQKPNDRMYIRLRMILSFGGVCNKEEIEQLTEIVYNAYKREKKA